MAVSRNYTSKPTQTTTSQSMTNTDMGPITLSGSGANLPPTPFFAVLDRGQAGAEEVVLVTSVINNAGAWSFSMTTRGVDGTTAVTHAAGASFEHCVTATDYADSRQHEANSTGVHGLAGGSSVVGTADVQTLLGKTFQAASTAGVALTVSQAGSGYTGDLQQWLNSSGTALARVDVNGNLTAANVGTLGPVVAQTTPPTNTNAIWIDTSS